MKKVLSFILTISLMALCLPTMAQNVAEVKFVKEIIPSDSETPVYREMTSTEHGNVAVQAVVPESVFADSEVVKVYFVKYNGNGVKQLESVAVASISAQQAGSPVTTTSFECSETDVIRAFLWDGTSITPIAASVEIPEKTVHVTYDFESEDYEVNSALAALRDKPQARKDINNITVVNDPLGQNGKVLKFDASASSATANFIEATEYRASINKFLDKTSSSVEFDFYMPKNPSRTITSVDEDGNPVYGTRDLYFRMNFGTTVYAQIQLRTTATNGISVRHMLNTNSGYGTLVADKYTNTDFYGKWHTFKLTYAPMEGNDNACEYYYWLDGELLYHKVGLNTKVADKNYISRNIYIGTYSASYGDENAVFYIDNVKFSA